jgi:multiple sugar transport system substrate-binding protein
MRRSTLRLFAISWSLLLATACMGDGDGGSAQPVSIRLQVSGEREETAVYRAVVKTFEKDNPQIDVTLVEVADKDDHLAKLATSFSAGDPPDVFLVNFREYSQFVARGAIAPFENHLESQGMDLGDYYDEPIEAFTYDGEVQCMPQNVSSLVVYFNTDLFDRAEIEPPFEGWTWDEFRDTALKLTRGDVRGVGIEPSVIRVAPFVWSNGGELVDDEAEPTRFTFDDPSSREALDFVVSLARDDEVVPTEREVAAEDLETRFTTGKIAMLLSSRRETPPFREVSGLNFDVLPLPTAEQPAGILHSDGYCLAAQGDEQTAAAELIAYATGEQGQTITALGGRTVPSLRSVASSPAFLDPLQAPAHSQVFLDAIPVLRRTPVIPTWPEIEDLAEEILIRAFYEPGYTVDDAIRALDEQTTELFAEAG